jgi:LuxR family maltose regulon positive regulatory protein
VPAESRLLPVLDPVTLLQARRCLLQGDVTAVREWLESEGVETGDELAPWGHPVSLMLARVLVAEGRPVPALDLLGRLAAAVERVGHGRLAIEVYAVQALARQALGETAKALDALRRALELATPEGAVRPFLELGPPLAALMRPLAADFPEVAVRVSGAAPAPIEIDDSRLLEPLSTREREVLELLFGGLSNKEIAARLFVSVNTVKTHVRNIYGKIGAGNRSQAMVRIRELGLL